MHVSITHNSIKLLMNILVWWARRFWVCSLPPLILLSLLASSAVEIECVICGNCHTQWCVHTHTHIHTHKILPIQTSRLFFWGFAWTPCTPWTVGLLNHTWNSSVCWRAGGSQEDNSPFILIPGPMASVQPWQACPTLWGAGQLLRTVAQKKRWGQEKQEQKKKKR